MNKKIYALNKKKYVKTLKENAYEKSSNRLYIQKGSI